MKHPFFVCIYGMAAVIAATIIGEPLVLVAAILLLLLALKLGF